MDRSRRRWLRGLAGAGAVGLAGCTRLRADGTDDGGPGAGTDPGGTATDGGSGDTRPSGTGGPGVAVVAVDEPPDLPVRPAVAVVREAATPEHPPRLRTTVENAGDERVTVGEGRAVHFEYVSDGTGSLVLLPADGEYPAEPDCWRLGEAIAVTQEYRTVDVGAGATSERLVDLYATPGDDGCLPVGEFRFETTVSVVTETAEPAASAEWGFSVVLE
jgi:hypothetical protein